MLVNQFIMGLKPESRGHVETQLPHTVAQAAVSAMIQEVDSGSSHGFLNQ